MKNNIRKLSNFYGYNQSNIDTLNFKKAEATVNKIVEESYYTKFDLNDIELLVRYLSNTDSLYGVNYPLVDAIEENSLFKEMADNVLLAPLPDYAISIKTLFLEIGATFVASMFFPKNINPLKDIDNFLKMIDSDVSPNQEEINFLCYLIYEKHYITTSFPYTSPAIDKIRSMIGNKIDFNYIRRGAEYMGALALILGNLDFSKKWATKSYNGNIVIYNAGVLLEKQNWKKEMNIFSNKNNILIVPSSLTDLWEKLGYIRNHDISYYHDLEQVFIRD